VRDVRFYADEEIDRPRLPITGFADPIGIPYGELLLRIRQVIHSTEAKQSCTFWALPI